MTKVYQSITSVSLFSALSKQTLMKIGVFFHFIHDLTWDSQYCRFLQPSSDMAVMKP